MARRNRVRILAAASACVLLAGCGSVIPPTKFLGDGGTGAAQSTTTNTGGNGPGVLVPQSNSTGTGALTGNPTQSGGTQTGAGGNPGGSAGNNGQTATTSQGATAGMTVGSCAGFTKSTGISNSTINLANEADVSGPVPGLFTGAQQAMKAYVAYFNQTTPNGICGHKLSLELLDSQTSSTGDEQASTTACGNAFAMVGSMGAFDDGGAQTVQHCGIPDLRAAATEQARINVPNVFGTMSLNASYIPTEPPKFYEQQYPTQTQHAAMLWLAAGAAQLNGQNEMKGFGDAGMHFVYSAGISVETFNYTTYVADMKSKGVQWVEFVGAIQYAVRLAQAMQSQNFKPVFVLDPEFYDPTFISSGGSAVEGTHIWVNQLPFEQASSSPEMQTYETWLQRTSPGAKPNYFGLFAWAAGRLFVQEAVALGGKLTRASLVNALRGVDNYTGNGLFGPQHVGQKVTASCYGFITLKGTTWVRENSGGNYICGSVVKVS
jgi:ABC-type branched-subunit amino acid transport system substrate-binding protein